MDCKQKFYTCKHCGNLIGMIKDSGVTPVCCGDPMVELIANTIEAAAEKHIPLVAVDGNSVKVEVGSVTHPMTEEHYIEWIYIQTKHGGQRKCLSPGDAPRAEFVLQDDTFVAAYAYCNLHGLWMK